MALDLAQERQQAHTYLDQLPAAQLAAVRHLLESMVDPVSAALANAPVDAPLGVTCHYLSRCRRHCSGRKCFRWSVDDLLAERPQLPPRIFQDRPRASVGLDGGGEI